ncbi:Tannase/feruloyl esterase [Aspergillus californicus]
MLLSIIFLVLLGRLHGVEILSVTGTPVQNYTASDLSIIASTNVTAIDFCNVTATLTHPGEKENDLVVLSIWLPPPSTWNGNYLATGGGGLVAGYFASRQAPGVALGYATASTDAGLPHDTVNGTTGSWAIKSHSDGSSSPNTALLTNFAFRSIHDMNVIGKEVIRRYYGVSHRYSYYHGCSTGGRQGYMSATYYPEDFDGILAIAPAINTPQLSPALFWPAVVMGNSVAPPQCVFNVYQEAIVAACDPLDGVADGLISTYDPDKCAFNVTVLIGESIFCTDTNSTITITPAHASVIHHLLQGPADTHGKRLWYGIPPGASFSGLADTEAQANGTITIHPFDSAEAWIKYLVFQNATYPTASMTYADFQTAFSISVARFSPQWDTLTPHLEGFRDAGAKLLSWHGLADEYISAAGTTRYYDAVREQMGGVDEVNSFYRLFLAPGVAHCSGGYGPVPVDAWEMLTGWVEDGRAPDRVFAEGVGTDGSVVRRRLCAYPSRLVYDGVGDVHEAGSFGCEY